MKAAKAVSWLPVGSQRETDEVAEGKELRQSLEENLIRRYPKSICKYLLTQRLYLQGIYSQIDLFKCTNRMPQGGHEIVNLETRGS